MFSMAAPHAACRHTAFATQVHRMKAGQPRRCGTQRRPGPTLRAGKLDAVSAANSILGAPLTFAALLIALGAFLKDAFNERLKGFEKNVDEKFKVVGDKLDAMDRKFDNLDRKFDNVDRKFDNVDLKFDAMDAQLKASADNVDRKFDKMEAKIDRKFDAVGDKIDRLAGTLNTAGQLGLMLQLLQPQVAARQPVQDRTPGTAQQDE